ncbi:MAG TPA: dihydrofolate reductase family protein [Myxococcaceae bacterium]|jgi:dihydrofolate reductase
MAPTSRRFIAALQISLDGFVQGPEGEEGDWVESWADALGLIPDVDAFVQGAGMYPGYGEYWKAIQENPTSHVPFQERLPTKREIEYARLAAKTPHHVLSRTLEGVSWPPTARTVRDVSELRRLKEEPGQNVYVVGGPTLVRNLLNEGLIDELRLIVRPILLASGKPLFEGVGKRRALHLVGAEPGKDGRVVLTYRT